MIALIARKPFYWQCKIYLTWWLGSPPFPLLPLASLYWSGLFTSNDFVWELLQIRTITLQSRVTWVLLIIFLNAYTCICTCIKEWKRTHWNTNKKHLLSKLIKKLLWMLEVIDVSNLIFFYVESVCNIYCKMYCIYHWSYQYSVFLLQQFGKIIDVEIIFNERGSKVRLIVSRLNHHSLFNCLKVNIQW